MKLQDVFTLAAREGKRVRFVGEALYRVPGFVGTFDAEMTEGHAPELLAMGYIAFLGRVADAPDCLFVVFGLGRHVAFGPRESETHARESALRGLIEELTEFDYHDSLIPPKGPLELLDRILPDIATAEEARQAFHQSPDSLRATAVHLLINEIQRLEALVPPAVAKPTPQARQAPPEVDPKVLTYAEKRDRFRGALLGLAVGDALGVGRSSLPLETGMAAVAMSGGGHHALPAGAWTGATAMTLCLAESLALQGRFDGKDQMQRYRTWYLDGHLSSTGVCLDVDPNVLNVLDPHTSPLSGLSISYRGLTSGALVRVAPIPMFFLATPEEALDRARYSTQWSHRHRAAKAASVYLAGLMIGALSGVPKMTLLHPEYCPVEGYYKAHSLGSAIRSFARSDWSQPLPESGHDMDEVDSCLRAAVWAFCQTDTFEEGARLAIALADGKPGASAVGAVYGQLAGAYYGEAAIPAGWRNSLLDAHRIGWFAEALFVHALRPDLDEIKQMYCQHLSARYLIASSDPRSPRELQADLGPGLFVDHQRLVETPMSARFDPSADFPPPRDQVGHVTYMFIREATDEDF